MEEILISFDVSWNFFILCDKNVIQFFFLCEDSLMEKTSFIVYSFERKTFNLRLLKISVNDKYIIVLKKK